MNFVPFLISVDMGFLFWVREGIAVWCMTCPLTGHRGRAVLFWTIQTQILTSSMLGSKSGFVTGSILKMSFTFNFTLVLALIQSLIRCKMLVFLIQSQQALTSLAASSEISNWLYWWNFQKSLKLQSPSGNLTLIFFF